MKDVNEGNGAWDAEVEMSMMIILKVKLIRLGV